MSLDERCRTAEAYRDLLTRFWGLYQPLEVALDRLHHQGDAPVFAGRNKVGWIAADLTALGLRRQAIDTLPIATRLPRLENGKDALGVLYVTEGASLGGQIIARRLAIDLGLTPETGARFFSSYRDQVGARWREFIAALERHAGDEVAAASIEASALATFDCFLAWFGAEPRPTPRLREACS